MSFEIYYLDDEEELCSLFEQIFASPKWVITTFSKPAELCAAVRVRRPDCIVVDMRLPGASGDEVIRSLGIDVPFVIVTGDLTCRSESEGVTVFYKPYREEDILGFLNRCVEQQRDGNKSLD